MNEEMSFMFNNVRKTIKLCLCLEFFLSGKPAGDVSWHVDAHDCN